MSKPKVQNKKSSKDAKKSLEKALMTAYKMAANGETAAIQHKGQVFVMARKDIFDEGVRNNGQFNLSPEQKEFQKSYQKLLETMGKLQYEVKDRDQFDTDDLYKMHVDMMNRNLVLFNGLDEFTFEFSEAMPKSKAERKRVTDEFNKYFIDNPILEQVHSGRLK